MKKYSILFGLVMAIFWMFGVHDIAYASIGNVSTESAFSGADMPQAVYVAPPIVILPSSPVTSSSTDPVATTTEATSTEATTTDSTIATTTDAVASTTAEVEQYNMMQADLRRFYNVQASCYLNVSSEPPRFHLMLLRLGIDPYEICRDMTPPSFNF